MNFISHILLKKHTLSTLDGYKRTLMLIFILCLPSVNAFAQDTNSLEKRAAIQELDPIITSQNTADKPQSKLWFHDQKWWCVLPDESGTVLWRLDGLQWTRQNILWKKNDIHADAKADSNLAHVLLFRGEKSELASLEYNSTKKTYERWKKRPKNIVIPLDAQTESATLDIDSKKRMWIAYDKTEDIEVIWSDPPYSSWSSPIKIATGTSKDDLCAITALPNNQIAVMWSNQVTKSFGFKTHNDNDEPSLWSQDEVPAGQYALNVGDGLGDDHINLAVASNGDLFAAVKTSYDTKGYAKIALLVRRANTHWEDVHYVDDYGTRPIVCLNEKSGKLQIIYSGSKDIHEIVYKESSLNPISFGPLSVLINHTLNNSTSTKQNYTDELVVMASDEKQAIGVKVEIE